MRAIQCIKNNRPFFKMCYNEQRLGTGAGCGQTEGWECRVIVSEGQDSRMTPEAFILS